MNAANPFDYNTADKSAGFDLIPANTVAPMILTIRPGSAGDGGWLTASKTSDVMYLNVELAITAGRYRGRKIWQNMVVSGGKVDEAGNSKAGNITRSTLRAILESARGIKPDDESPQAKQNRMVSGYGDFSGLEFVGKVGIEKGSEGYADKNKLLAAVPVDSPAYAEAKDGAASAPAYVAPAAKAPSTVPAWAN
jgi:hypothetical protein